MRESQGMQATRNLEAHHVAESGDVEQVMTIQCSHGHHLARVLSSAKGHVVEANLHRRSHGRRDLHSDPHGVDEPSLWWDFLDPVGQVGADDPAVDDAIPVGCACGDRLLSRSAIRTWMLEGETRPLID